SYHPKTFGDNIHTGYTHYFTEDDTERVLELIKSFRGYLLYMNEIQYKSDHLGAVLKDASPTSSTVLDAQQELAELIAEKDLHLCKAEVFLWQQSQCHAQHSATC
ncbi:hypothetical protein RRG08_003259, partial [Elysia crispata]